MVLHNGLHRNKGRREKEKRQMDDKENSLKITHLKCREIQAPIVSSLIKGFAREIGHNKALEIAKQVIREDAILSGKMLAEGFSGNSIAEMSRIVKDVWAKDGALEIRILKETESELFFDVTYCGYARIYEKMGIKELGCILSCNRDFAFMEGFNPEIKLTRTKTIMEGEAYCDFRYVKE
jgi:hypothetical protein